MTTAAGFVVAGTISLAAVVGGAGMIAARVMGVADGSTSVLLAIVGAVSACVTAVLAARQLIAGGATGRGLVVVAALLAGYLLVNAVCAYSVGVVGLRGPLAEVLVAVTLAWFIVPMSAAQLLVLAVARRHGARGTRIAGSVLLTGAAGGFIVGFAAVEPEGAYSPISAPLADLDSPVTQVVFGAFTIVWMGAVAASGVVAWWGIRPAAGTRRHRLALTAVAGILPVWTITLCLGLTPVLFWGDTSQLLAADLLALVFAAPFPVAGAALVLADTASDEWLRRRSATLLVTTFSVAVGGIAVVAAASIGVAIGTSGAGSAVPAVLVAVGVAVASGLVRRRWAAALDAWLDPDRARARALLNTVETDRFLSLLERVSGLPAGAPSQPVGDLAGLSSREREVLELLSGGLSNAAIASRLFLSERTIDSHMRSIFSKLDLDLDLETNRRVQAAAIWLRASTDSALTGVSTDGWERSDP